MSAVPDKGFTLIEMAMVLMIVGLLLGGMLIPLSAQMEQRNISDTEKSLSEAREAIIGYALANGQLPCPADPAIATGSSNAGVARTPPCTGSDSSGVLPWVTLGLNETDAWGNRYTYRVTDYFADSIASATYGTGCTPSSAPANSSFALCSAGDLDIYTDSSVTTKVADSVPAVIISHGKNAAGAYSTSGTQIAIGGNADELENSDGSTNKKYVSHPRTPDFDDIVVWISPSILLNRMVTAGKLP